MLETLALVPHENVYTPADLNFNGVTWRRSGTLSFDVPTYGLTLFTGYAISQEAWAVDYYVYREDDGALLWGPVQLGTGVGTAGGQVEHQPFTIGPLQAYAQNIRFRGRGLFLDSPESFMRVMARG